MFNKKYLKSEIKFSSEKINTILIDNGMPKGGSHFVSLSVILIHFVFKTGKSYYSQEHFEEPKNFVIEKKIRKYIHDDLELFHDSDHSDNSDLEKNCE